MLFVGSSSRCSSALLAALSLVTCWPLAAQSQSSALDSSSSAPPTPATTLLTRQDFETFLVDSATVRQELEASRQALKNALALNEAISKELQLAMLELQSYRDSSTPSYSDLSARVQTLLLQLSASRSSVDELQRSLASQEAEFQQGLAAATSAADDLARRARTAEDLAIAGGLAAAGALAGSFAGPLGAAIGAAAGAAAGAVIALARPPPD